VGSERFVREIKSELGIWARGRRVKESREGFQLREPVDSYNAIFDAKNVDIDPGNSYLRYRNHHRGHPQSKKYNGPDCHE